MSLTNPELWEEMVYALTGGLAIAACLMSAHLIYKHLRHWANPKQQKLIIRLLLMVPIYSVDSFLSLRWRFLAPYLNCVRDGYEGYALWCFFSLLLAYVEGDDGDCGTILAKKARIKHPLPFCMLPTLQPGPLFVLWCKRLCLQFAFVKPAIAVITLILVPFGLEGNGSFSPKQAYLYFTVATNISVFVALYALVLFYLAAKEELVKFSPVGKFLSIKSILFFTFWQGIIIAILNHYNTLTVIGSWTEQQVGVGLQDFCVCVEMFLLSIVHIYAFEFQSYQDAIAVQPNANEGTRFVPWQNFKPVIKNFASTMSQRDLFNQVGSILNRDASHAARQQEEALFATSVKGGIESDAEEKTPLIEIHTPTLSDNDFDSAEPERSERLGFQADDAK